MTLRNILFNEEKQFKFKSEFALFAVMFLFLFTPSCVKLPAKPNVNLCVIDLPRQQLICAPTVDVQRVEQWDYKKMVKMVATNPERIKIPLSEADRFIAFSPDDWEKVSNYTKILRDYAQNNCH